MALPFLKFLSEGIRDEKRLHFQFAILLILHIK